MLKKESLVRRMRKLKVSGVLSHGSQAFVCLEKASCYAANKKQYVLYILLLAYLTLIKRYKLLLK